MVDGDTDLGTDVIIDLIATKNGWREQPKNYIEVSTPNGDTSCIHEHTMTTVTGGSSPGRGRPLAHADWLWRTLIGP